MEGEKIVAIFVTWHRLHFESPEKKMMLLADNFECFLCARQHTAQWIYRELA